MYLILFLILINQSVRFNGFLPNIGIKYKKVYKFTVLNVNSDLSTPKAAFSNIKVFPNEDSKHKYKFLRSNRMDAQVLWVNELCLLRKQSLIIDVHNKTYVGINLMIELANQLINSGIPEQVIELYNLYHEIISKNDGKRKHSITFVPNIKLIFLTTKALIKINDIPNAIQLIKEAERFGLAFDPDSRSNLIEELAIKSLTGLQTALEIRELCCKNNESIGFNGIIGILSGIIDHGITKKESNYPLLLRSSDIESENKQGIGSSSGKSFTISIDKAIDIAYEILEEYSMLKSKSSKKVVSEALRVLFKVGLIESIGSYDKNFEPDVEQERNNKVILALSNVIEGMIRFNTTWNANICDMLIQECMDMKDFECLDFILHLMDKTNIEINVKTFNHLLKKYIDTDEGENAYHLCKFMEGKNSTQPNLETWDLLLQATNKNQKDRYYSQLVIKDLILNNKMNKPLWERFIEISILTDKPPDSIIEKMIDSNISPDLDTFYILVRTYLDKGDLDKGLMWFRRLRRAEKSRIDMKQKLLTAGINSEVVIPNEKLQASNTIIDSYFPPPDKKIVLMILDALKSNGRYKEAVTIIEELIIPNDLSFTNIEKSIIIEQTESSNKNPSQMKIVSIENKKIVYVKALSKQAQMESSSKAAPNKISKEITITSQYRPCVEAYSHTIEACILANKPEVGLKLFADMEKLGLVPDRKVYSLLIQIFGLLGDINSALGVFDEMRTFYPPDTYALNSMIRVCMQDPVDIRQAAILLEKMSDEGVNLDVFSQDILMETFPDAITLGKVLLEMQNQPILSDVQVVPVSLAVISCLVQASIKGPTPAEVINSIILLGRLGIRIDKETVEYFTFPNIPKDNSPLSKHYYESLLPHKDKVRSLLNIDMPTEYKNSYSFLASSPQRKSELVFSHSELERFSSLLKKRLNSDEYFTSSLNEFNNEPTKNLSIPIKLMGQIPKTNINLKNLQSFLKIPTPIEKIKVERGNHKGGRKSLKSIIEDSDNSVELSIQKTIKKDKKKKNI